MRLCDNRKRTLRHGDRARGEGGILRAVPGGEGEGVVAHKAGLGEIRRHVVAQAHRTVRGLREDPPRRARAADGQRESQVHVVERVRGEADGGGGGVGVGAALRRPVVAVVATDFRAFVGGKAHDDAVAIHGDGVGALHS